MTDSRVVTSVRLPDFDACSSYRKLPVEVKAVQVWTSGTVETLEGRMEFHAGDWLIRGIAGEVYPCRDDIFRATYEYV